MKDAEKKARARDERAKAGLAKIMRDPDTRFWLHAQLEEAGPFREAFTGSSETFYRCGQQAQAKRTVAYLMENFLDEYVLMMREAKQT